jgi:Fe-Mn family superoxide dismutase
MSIHVLPELPYAYDALEPHIDARTMEIHHTKHHNAYVTNLNKALEKADKIKGAPIETLLKDLALVPEEIREAVRNNGGGHFNHSFFWPLMGKGKGGSPIGMLERAIKRGFGSISAFQQAFQQAALTRFGSGWAWLSLDKDGNLVVHSTPNQDSPLADGRTPILGLDVWEHAYYLKYQNRRPEYVEAWWNVVDWERANANYLQATG